MIVTVPFRAVRFSSRDDPNDFFLGPSMADKQKFVHQTEPCLRRFWRFLASSHSKRASSIQWCKYSSNGCDPRTRPAQQNSGPFLSRRIYTILDGPTELAGAALTIR